MADHVMAVAAAPRPDLSCPDVEADVDRLPQNDRFAGPDLLGRDLHLAVAQRYLLQHQGEHEGETGHGDTGQEDQMQGTDEGFRSPRPARRVRGRRGLSG